MAKMMHNKAAIAKLAQKKYCFPPIIVDVVKKMPFSSFKSLILKLFLT